MRLLMYNALRYSITYVNKLFPSPALQSDVKYACSWQTALQIIVLQLYA